MALRKDGQGAVVSLQRGFHLLDFQTGDVDLIHDPEPDRPDNRLNDGKVDKRGRFVAGSMDTMEQGPNGALYSLSTDFEVTRLDQGIICSNGPCWSPDGSTFYFNDTWSGEIWAYDYDLDTGGVSNRRCFAKVDTAGGGAADGSTVDAEGCLWNALVYDGKLTRYRPDGTVDRVIDMPVKKVTSVMFGGPRPRRALRHLDGQAAAAALSRRRGDARQPSSRSMASEFGASSSPASAADLSHPSRRRQVRPAGPLLRWRHGRSRRSLKDCGLRRIDPDLLQSESAGVRLWRRAVAEAEGSGAAQRYSLKVTAAVLLPQTSTRTRSSF